MHWRYRDTVLLLCTLAFFATMVARLGISPLIPFITDDFRVSNAAIGAALTGMWFAYGLSQLPSGLLGNRIGERRVVLLSLAGTAIGMLVIAVSPILSVFVLGVVVLGALVGLHFNVASTLITRYYDNIGTALGIHIAGGPAAGFVTPLVVVWIAIRFGWRAAIVVGALVAIVGFVLFAWFVEPTPPRGPNPSSDPGEFQTAVGVILRPEILFTVGLAVTGAFAWQAVASFLPTFLVQHRGQSPTTAAALFSAYFLVQMGAQVAVGSASDRIGRDTTLAGCMSLSTVGIALFIYVPDWFAMGSAVLFLGIGLSWASAVLPRCMDLLSEAERNVGFGLVRTIYMLVGSLGSVVAGLMADLFGWPVAFGFFAALCGITVVVLFLNWSLCLDY